MSREFNPCITFKDDPNYMERFLVNRSGGHVHKGSKVVSKVGIMPVLLGGELTKTASRLFDEILQGYWGGGITTSLTDQEKFVDFSAKLTYMSFNNTEPKPLLEKLVNLGHLNCFEYKPYAFLVAGCSLEAVLELVSNRYNRSCRMTSSNCIHATSTLYCPYIDEDFLDKFLALKEECGKVGCREENNMHNLSGKAGYLMISMEKGEWYSLITSRVRDNGEKEVTDILLQIKRMLDEN